MTRLFVVLAFSSIIVLVSCREDTASVTPDGPKKLDYYIESYQLSGVGFEVHSKVAYEYNSSGKVSEYTISAIEPKTGAVENQRLFVFSYKGDQLEKISAYDQGAASPYLEDTYEYFEDGTVSKITEVNKPAGVNSEAKFTYQTADQTIKVYYTFSNGGSFEYEFKYSNENILNDKTTKGAELCSDGQYTYDNHINPFGNLGYVDYLLTTLSRNNKLTENVNHVHCSFPTLVPESYTYEYDVDGYPTLATTFYKSKDNSTQSKKEFFYK